MPKLAPPGLGQVTGLALDEEGGRIYAIHRAANTFLSTATIGAPAIVAFSYSGELLPSDVALGKDLFVVPHGRSCPNPNPNTPDPTLDPDPDPDPSPNPNPNPNPDPDPNPNPRCRTG